MRSRGSGLLLKWRSAGFAELESDQLYLPRERRAPRDEASIFDCWPFLAAEAHGQLQIEPSASMVVMRSARSIARGREAGVNEADVEAMKRDAS